MALDPVFVSRLQFAWVIALHIVLPAFTVGLACFVALLEFQFWRTANPVYFRISGFWLKILRSRSGSESSPAS